MVNQIGIKDEHFFMEDDSRVYVTETINFNETRIVGQGKPTQVFLGVHSGYSLPIFAADDEELFTCKSSSLLWDTTEDVVVFIGGYLSLANNAKKFNMQVSWNCADLGAHDVLDATSDDVEVETDTGNWAQFTGFKTAFILPTVLAGCSNGDKLAFRVRRIAATADEIAGEVVVCGMALRYVANKSGKPIV